MKLEREIRDVISEYYPSNVEYTIDKYPNNSYCKLLMERCKLALNENSIWLSFLNSPKHKNFKERIDESLLVGGEPCYRCSIATLKSKDTSIVVTYFVQVSVIFDCYFLYMTKSRLNPSPPPLIEHFGYDFDLPGTAETNYFVLKGIVEEFFPGHEELRSGLVHKTVNNVRVPNKFGPDPPSIFECLFGVRMF